MLSLLEDRFYRRREDYGCNLSVRHVTEVFVFDADRMIEGYHRIGPGFSPIQVGIWPQGSHVNRAGNCNDVIALDTPLPAARHAEAAEEKDQSEAERLLHSQLLESYPRIRPIAVFSEA